MSDDALYKMPPTDTSRFSLVLWALMITVMFVVTACEFFENGEETLMESE